MAKNADGRPPPSAQPGYGCCFPPISSCSPQGREKHSVVADLDGTLLRGRSSFPYFFLVALEAGSVARAAALLLYSPLAWVLYHFISESAGIQVLIFVSFVGLRVRDIEAAAGSVLAKFYAEDVHPLAWRAFTACGRRRCVVTANPRIMVERFALAHLGAHKVLATEIHVTASGRATGFVSRPGVLVGTLKKDAVKKEFGNNLPELGMGDRMTDYPFLSLCKEGYMVPPMKVPAVPMKELAEPVIFHDGRLAVRPTPGVALLVLVWIPLGFLLALIRIVICISVPTRHVRLMYKLLGVGLVVRGVPPLPPRKSGGNVLFVCSHRTLLDPVILSVVLGRRLTSVTYGISHVSEVISPIKTVRLTRDRELDARRIRRLLQDGADDLVICPEGTTCREPYLLRFSALFAELSDKIVPVAMHARPGMFHGSTVHGWKGMDPFFFFMNPCPQYEITFLDMLPLEQTVAGGKSAYDVANYTQQLLASTLGFECTSLTRKQKYNVLAGTDGSNHK